MYLSFDEWNVWYQQHQKPHDWEFAPPILEDHYSLLDALVVGGMGITLLNNANRVKIACLAQLVNVIAPIFTQKGGAAIRQTIFYPFRDISLYGRGTVLVPVLKAPIRETRYGDAPVVASSVVFDEESGEITLFMLNTDKNGKTELNLDLRSFGLVHMISRTVLAGPDLQAINSFDCPEAVKPVSLAVDSSPAARYSLSLDPVSWNVIRFKTVSE